MHLPNPVIRSHYRNGFIKQYVRDHLILRTEAATNNVNDYGVNKAVENLPELARQAVGDQRQLPRISSRTSSRRLSTADNCDKLAEPTITARPAI